MSKIYSMRSGTSLVEGLLEIARKEGMTTAGIAAIGGVNELKIAHFNSVEKKYEEHAYHEFLEVTTLNGNITVKDGAPFLHVHGTFGRRDMSVIGGHVVSATVFPLMEVTIALTENTAIRRFDDETGLNAIWEVRPATERRGSV